MKTVYRTLLAGCLLGLSPLAMAEVANLTNSAEGANREAGITAVKKKLQEACESRKGKVNMDSFEVVFEKTNPNPDVPKPYYVDAKIKCDLP
ncbi:hypothetical protein [Xanthomonas maliensis]|uniref:hypothetical protein n=2 Tax=Xanthomonas maliensis TaxID=1321368 RepID=UPI001264B319|nr:hypothetical protein [Xanthomonas maliensis]KAB7771795.1 hypothetical protein CKY51_01870 [Xanthomonas maliensis]